ncbi:MAG: molybdenum cofactor biosynthesis protein MoaE [Candidatus Korarchaeota archaeon]|nr:molybdenum cofactor biosynthesis protein MoaE [Candidatus Korarchaeota archaeon]NIU84141.1 hypothetical protein [Candidatus Thorarchaeota archaeon]NIW14286.1 hypothetical protein [Candidatus Thorarchaeota archaeon]NIW52383.1 hypothetical protein [Candidatus Korarchaeota archaeon]
MQKKENKVGIVSRNSNISLLSLYDRLKATENIDQCGAIVSFIGIVRGSTNTGKKVKALHFETEKDIALVRLQKIRKKLLEKYKEVKDLIIYHVVDDVEPRAEIMYILAASSHRSQAFQSVKEAVELIKSEIPIWKKELREDESVWISSHSEKK